MITPINGHIIIEPVVHESFISSQKETYDEIGIVVDTPNDLPPYDILKIGTRVFFDSWMTSKYPKNDKEYYWLVPFENIKAYEE